MTPGPLWCAGNVSRQVRAMDALKGYPRLIDQGTRTDPQFPDNYVSTTHFTAFNFLPLAVFNQFRKLANVYFLMIAILCTTPISPFAPITAIAPVVFVVMVGVVREGVEDYFRRCSDREQNSKTALVLSADTQPEFVAVAWRDIHVGDLVWVRDKQPIPADLVLLWSSAENGVAYIDTMNLDGETNLKRRKAKDATTPLFRISDVYTAAAHARECVKLGVVAPDGDLYKFRGALHLSSTFSPPREDAAAASVSTAEISLTEAMTVDVNEDQLLLRGSSIRNTPVAATGGTNGWVVGLVVYSGHETKEMQNSKEAVHKSTRFEKKLNLLILLLFCVQCVLCFVAGILGGMWATKQSEAHTYLNCPDDCEGARTGVLMAFAFIILLNTFIPASLVVSIEVVKVFHALFINWDLQMFHGFDDPPAGGKSQKRRPKRASAKSMTLQEELGQITHVFSDKTGTLTENKMEFRNCVVAGDRQPYGDTGGGVATDGHQPLAALARRASGEPGGIADMFLTSLAVAHTVLLDADADTGEVSYNADSPDEVALVKGGVAMRYSFESRQGERSIFISKDGRPFQYEILATIEFTSARKRMSVVVRQCDSAGSGARARAFVLTKGADSVMLDPQQETSSATARPARVRDCANARVLRQQLDKYALEGLRTLVFAYKPLAPGAVDLSDPGAWLRRFQDARCLPDAEQASRVTERLALELEDDLELLGATAIEDRLQTGVPWTIRRLADASISLWVLTGDKRETAIEIAKSCALITTWMEVHELVCSDEASLMEALTDACGRAASSERPQGVVIDGATLSLVVSADHDGLLVCHRPSDLFVTLTRLCQSVVLARSSPLQKALVVMLVKKYEPSAITLAIGDGANDVSMIRAAHVGIGVAGQEGMQAVRSSDYAIQEFRDLQRLLLHHGRLSHMRLATMTTYFFYKNIVFTFVLWVYGALSAWSAQTFYVDMLVTVYNSALPGVMARAMEGERFFSHCSHIPPSPRLSQCCSRSSRLSFTRSVSRTSRRPKRSSSPRRILCRNATCSSLGAKS